MPVSQTPQGPAKETSPVGSTMLHQGCVDSLYMEGAGVMIIDSRQRNFVSRDVGYLQNKVRCSSVYAFYSWSDLQAKIAFVFPFSILPLSLKIHVDVSDKPVLPPLSIEIYY